MINIAIVEDELQEARQIAGYLKKFAAANRLQISVKAYSNAESFLAEESRAFRLVFFDIRLPGIDGLTAALKFREKNTDAVIIFITNMVQFAIRGYEVNARDYILKPLIYSDFEFKMKKLLPLFREKDKPKAFLSVKGRVQQPHHSVFPVEEPLQCGGHRPIGPLPVRAPGQNGEGLGNGVDLALVTPG